MPSIIGYHQVKDRDHWLSSDLREKKFGELGVTNIRTFTDPTNSARVAVSGDVPDLPAFMAWLQSEAEESLKITINPESSMARAASRRASSYPGIPRDRCRGR